MHDREEVGPRGEIFHRTVVGGYQTALATDGNISGRIVCDTFLRYKGLERPAIIVTDIQPDVEKYGVRMNIVVSRAYGVLRLVCARGEIAKDEFLRLCA